jgi:DNA-directed RNA polymerase specialized sigma24 family protein
MPMIGSADADFDRYVAASGSALLRLAYLLTGEESDGEELFQEVLMIVYTHWDTIRCLDKRDAYVRTIMVNKNRRWHRRHAILEIPHANVPEAGVMSPAIGAIEDSAALGQCTVRRKVVSDDFSVEGELRAATARVRAQVTADAGVYLRERARRARRRRRGSRPPPGPR